VKIVSSLSDYFSGTQTSCLVIERACDKLCLLL